MRRLVLHEKPALPKPPDAQRAIARRAPLSHAREKGVVAEEGLDHFGNGVARFVTAQATASVLAASMLTM
jgi:hypothetical protein